MLDCLVAFIFLLLSRNILSQTVVHYHLPSKYLQSHSEFKSVQNIMGNSFCTEKFPELTEKIFIYLDTSSAIQCRLVSRTFNHIINNPYFWLRKLAFDAEQKNLLKMIQSVSCVDGKYFSIKTTNNLKIKNHPLYLNRTLESI